MLNEKVILYKKLSITDGVLNLPGNKVNTPKPYSALFDLSSKYESTYRPAIATRIIS